MGGKYWLHFWQPLQISFKAPIKLNPRSRLFQLTDSRGIICVPRFFHELGYYIFIFDYRGFGKSDGKFPTESQVYEDAQAAWNYVTQERNIPANQIIIYGHSVGGAIAINLASKHPEAAALIVHNSFTSIRDMTKRFGLYWLFPVELILRQRFESLDKIKTISMPTLI